MGKKSGPPPPDYTAAAQQQQQSNAAAVMQQTWANRADQTNPWGSQTWTNQQAMDDQGKPMVDANGQPVLKWQQTTTVDPQLQAALNSQINVQLARSQQAEQMIPQMQQQFGQPIDYSGLSRWGQGPQAGNLQATTGAYGFGPQTQGVQRGLDFGNVQQVQGGAPAMQTAQNAAYQQATSRLDPQWQQQQTQLENQLAQSGISKNSDAYTRAMADFNRQKTDAYNQATYSSIGAGNQAAQQQQQMDLALRGQQVGEIGQQGQFANQAANQAFQQQLAQRQYGLQQQQQAFGQQQNLGAQNFNQQMAQANYANQLRQQQMQEMIQQRGFSLNEMQALLNGQQVSMPQFGGYQAAGNAGGVDYSGAAQNQFNAGMQGQSASNAATGQAIGGIASMAMMFSDARVKQLIKPVALDPRGFRIWWFRYFGETLPRLGVVAQEVREHAPELVHEHRSGLLMVDYSRL